MGAWDPKWSNKLSTKAAYNLQSYIIGVRWAVKAHGGHWNRNHAFIIRINSALMWFVWALLRVVKHRRAAARLQTKWQLEFREINTHTRSVWMNVMQFKERSGAFLSAPPLQTEQAPLPASSCLSSITLQRKITALKKIRKTTFTASSRTKHSSPELTNTFKQRQITADTYHFQLKLIKRRGEPLLAYLPSIAMMFCFGFNQSGR